MLQQKTNRTQPINYDEISRAADLLLRFIKSPYPTLEVSEHLKEVDDLLFALLELNIRQARADGRTDLAQALQNLEDNLYLQLKGSEDFDKFVVEDADLEIAPDNFRILFLCQNNGELSLRNHTA